jgi:predicted 2-oxoglutarate/Fe(II)-dependent dioxygenase YbiX
MNALFTIKNLLSKEECDTIINKYLEEQELTPAALFGGVNLRVRKSLISFVELDSNISHLKERIVKEIESNIKIKGYNINFENKLYQFTKYGVGDYYNWHVDSTEDGMYAKRYCSMVIQLNDEYTGGELQLKHNDEIISLENGIGNMFVFSSNTTHRVNIVTNGTRYSLVNWFSLISRNDFKKTII